MNGKYLKGLIFHHTR